MLMLNAELPAGTLGKRPTITLRIEKQIVQAARALWPAAQALVELRKQSSKRNVAESIAYLEADYPEGMRVLAKHIDVLERHFARRGGIEAHRHKCAATCFASDQQ
jgi:soluble cytochrome b562